MLSLTNITVHFGQRTLFEHIDLFIGQRERVGLVGRNGAGKSTLLKLLLEEEPPTEGEVRRNHRLRTAYYSQHSAESLPLEATPVEHLIRKLQEFSSKEDDGTKQSNPEQYSRKLLGSCGLASHAHKIPIKDLSGGQKARVAIGELICSYPDIIILDEPTNNLDIESIDALAEAINAYAGGVIIVSHDARLITATECVLYVVENRNLRKVDGDFDDYKQEVMDELEAMLEKNS